MSTPNVELLDQVLAWCEKQQDLFEQDLPSEWNQGSWYWDLTKAPEEYLSGPIQRLKEQGCGTVCCIAGYVATVVDGLEPVVYHSGDACAVVPVNSDPDDAYADRLDMSDYAQERLGLTAEQASRLFEGTNTLGDVHRIIGEIKAGAL